MEEVKRANLTRKMLFFFFAYKTQYQAPVHTTTFSRFDNAPTQFRVARTLWQKYKNIWHIQDKFY